MVIDAALDDGDSFRVLLALRCDLILQSFLLAFDHFHETVDAFLNLLLVEKEGRILQESGQVDAQSLTVGHILVRLLLVILEPFIRVSIRVVLVLTLALLALFLVFFLRRIR